MLLSKQVETLSKRLFQSETELLRYDAILIQCAKLFYKFQIYYKA